MNFQLCSLKYSLEYDIILKLVCDSGIFSANFKFLCRVSCKTTRLYIRRAIKVRSFVKFLLTIHKLDLNYILNTSTKMFTSLQALDDVSNMLWWDAILHSGIRALYRWKSRQYKPNRWWEGQKRYNGYAGSGIVFNDQGQQKVSPIFKIVA